jgi:hypothetical protein
MLAWQDVISIKNWVLSQQLTGQIGAGLLNPTFGRNARRCFEAFKNSLQQKLVLEERVNVEA